MTVLSEKEYGEVLDLIYLANSCGNIEQFITNFLPVMSRSFHSDITTFHLLGGDPSEPVISESRGFYTDSTHSGEDKRNPKLYQNYYFRKSPLLREAIESSGLAFKIAAVMSADNWERHEFFYEFILPQHIYWEMFLALRWDNKLTGAVTLWRRKQVEDFDDTQLLQGEILAPHLMLVVHNLCQVAGSPDTGGADCDFRQVRLKLGTEYRLSQRELDILDRIVAGLSYDEIASQFSISKFTVHTHIKNIYMKIGIHNRIDLGRFIQTSTR